MSILHLQFANIHNTYTYYYMLATYMQNTEIEFARASCTAPVGENIFYIELCRYIYTYT